ncbi:head GIN domain-containing protein [Herminiimonas fonticola]|uniref:head GIN domain-containing protein n=1 Tax=Herminiimonas fonticola TaxID=303380 RepID=UPI0033420E27
MNNISIVGSLLTIVTLSCEAAGNSTATVHGSAGSNGNSVVIVNGNNVSSAGESVIGQGPIKEEVRPVARFNAVKIEGPVDVTYTISTTPSVRLLAQGNILPLITVEVVAGQLVLAMNGSFSTSAPIRALVSGPSPVAVGINGSGSFVGAGLAGAALQLRIAGSGNIKASGSVDAVNVVVAGSGDIDIVDIKAKSADIQIKGSGDVHAYASQSARVALSGSGDVRIKGAPLKRNVERAGSGDVIFE